MLKMNRTEYRHCGQQATVGNYPVLIYGNTVFNAARKQPDPRTDVLHTTMKLMSFRSVLIIKRHFLKLKWQHVRDILIPARPLFGTGNTIIYTI